MTTISTVEELTALPAGTVLRSANRLPVVELRRPPRSHGHDDVIARIGSEWHTLRSAAEWLAPLTVLHRPDLPTQADLHAAVERVRRMHRPDPSDRAFCESCDRQFPCPTWRELGGAP